MSLLTQFAASETAETGIFSVLGIDWKTLILQVVAFLILVWLLGKYVYPWLMKSVDERQATIEASTKAADEARKKAETAEKEVAKLLKEARTQATDIVATAKNEAISAVEAAEAKAKVRAETIVKNAHDEIAKDVIAAKKALHNETIDLVALTTEKILGNAVTSKVDDNVIATAMKDVR